VVTLGDIAPTDNSDAPAPGTIQDAQHWLRQQDLLEKGVTMKDPEDTSAAQDANDDGEQIAGEDLEEMLTGSTVLSQAPTEIVINTDIG
jgi:hypothetical protein